MDRRGSTEGTQRRTKATTEPCPATKGSPGADCLSALPDELLLHILSFLAVRQAVSTSYLSRRWRYLYRYLSSLDFYDDGYPDPIPIWFIDRILLLHAAPRIERFRPYICVKLDKDSSAFRQLYRQFDSWLLFAVRRGVRVLDLMVDDDGEHDWMSTFDTYVVPPWVFRCGTLEKFSATNCNLCLPSHVRLVSVKKMYFKWAEFGLDELKCLLRGCPLLQSLQLLWCNIETDLIIDARDCRTLEELVIVGDEFYQRDYTQMQIYAPSVKYLTFRTCSLRRKTAVMDLSSVVVASFELMRSLSGNEVDMFTTDLMLRIHQVQVLKLCRLSLEALSKRELQGSLVSAFPGVTRLELTVRLEGPADILSALHACSKLRTLVLRIMAQADLEDKLIRLTACVGGGAYVGGGQEELMRRIAEDDKLRWLAAEGGRPVELMRRIAGHVDSYDKKTGRSPRLLALDHHSYDVVLQDLKTVVIRGLKDTTAGSVAREEKKNRVIVWMGFLLRVSPVLEEVMVRPSGEWDSLSSSDLLSLPRATSPNVNVVMMDEGEVKHATRLRW